MEKLIIICIFVATFLDLVYSDCKDNYLCNSEFCTRECELSPNCGEEPIDEDCEDGILMQLYDNPKDFCSCCPPKCIKYIKEDEDCEPSVSDRVPTEMCGPRLACIENKCKPMDTNCIIEQNRVIENPGMNQRPPECDDEGYYMPKQCTSAKGLCRCVDKETGMPISSGGLEPGVVEAEASGMDCKCAQNYHQAIKQACLLSIHYSDYTIDTEYKADVLSCVEESSQKPMYNDETFFGEFGHMRCQPNGNYDPIQCVQQIGSEGLCFCIDTTSVELVKNESLVTFKDIESVDALFCYDPEKMFHNSEHYRSCEMETKEIYDLKKQHLNSGKIYIHSVIPPICSNDGFYGKLQYNTQNITERYCSDRNGEMIESFKGDEETLSGRKMNCECALARHYLTSSKPKCCDNGNYQSIQCIGGLCYCVDEYGRQIGEEVEQTDQHTLNCYLEQKKFDYCCELDPENYVKDDWCYVEA